MKNLLLIIGISIASFTYIQAQNIDKPLPNLIENEVKPEAPNENSVWVKGHWDYANGKYTWIKGAYVQDLANHNWVDGKWVKNQITDKWTFEAGQWEPVYNEITYNGVVYKSGIETNNSKIELLQVENLSLN